MEWQPIETALLEGNRPAVLIHTKEGETWTGLLQCNSRTGERFWVHGTETAECTIIALGGDGGYLNLIRNPTHWMPLPEAPK